ncbi:hypothetical protein V1509DRAFT_609425 [Lipomyces kononenkoae]
MNSPTVRHLVINMLGKRRDELHENSGAAEADTDLKQATDAFLERFDLVNAEVGSSKDKRNADDAKDRETTAKFRERLMHSKRTAKSADESDVDEGLEEERPWRKRLAVRKGVWRVWTSAFDPSMSEMVAVRQVANSMVADPTPQADERVAKLVESYGEVIEELRGVRQMELLLQRLG